MHDRFRIGIHLIIGSLRKKRRLGDGEEKNCKGETPVAYMKEIRFASKFWSIAEDFAAEILLFEHSVLLQKIT